MSIGFYDFQSLHNEQFRNEVKKRIGEIIDQNAFVEGKYNTSFENRFAKLQGAKHALLVGNGTDALEISLKVAGIQPGDKVGVAAISFFASAESVINVGGEVVFIDVDPQTGLLDPASLERQMKEHDLKAVMPVHIYGLPAPIKEIEALCKPKGIHIIEDAAQGQGGFYEHGGPIGSSGNFVTFSFYPTKNLGAFGDAGAILVQDDNHAEDILSHRNHGRSPEGHRLIGRNSRCDHFQAAALDLKLDSIDEQNAQRKKIAAWYFEELEGTNIRLVPKKYIETSSWHLYPIGLETKEKKYALREYLNSKQIGNALFYEKSQSQEKPLAGTPGEFKNADHFADTTICLPMNPFLSQEDVKVVCNAVKTGTSTLL